MEMTGSPKDKQILVSLKLTSQVKNEQNHRSNDRDTSFLCKLSDNSSLKRPVDHCLTEQKVDCPNTAEESMSTVLCN